MRKAFGCLFECRYTHSGPQCFIFNKPSDLFDKNIYGILRNQIPIYAIINERIRYTCEISYYGYRGVHHCFGDDEPQSINMCRIDKLINIT